MNLRLLIAALAGLGGGFLLPLPAPEAPARKSSTATSTDIVPLLQTWPRDVAAADALANDQCRPALDALLREFTTITPAPEQQRIALALLWRILESSDAAAFLKSHRLPAWLLTAAWLEKPNTVPDTLRRSLPDMPAGLAAARRIAETIAAGDEKRAAAFAATMPAAWRPALREAALLGLAAREPLRALREAPVDEGIHTDLARIAARSGPIEQAVQAINQYVDNDFYLTIKPMLAQLRARDAEKTAELIAATEDPKLQRWLDEVIAEAAAPNAVPSSAQSDPACQAVQNPAAAKAAWSALPAGTAKDQAACTLAAALAERDVADAFAWADQHSPRASFDVFRAASQTDLPGAIAAALRLPAANPLREQLLKDLRKNSPSASVSGFGLVSDKPAFLREIPADLQPLLAPDPVIPFDGRATDLK